MNLLKVLKLMGCDNKVRGGAIFQNFSTLTVPKVLRDRVFVGGWDIVIAYPLQWDCRGGDPKTSGQ